MRREPARERPGADELVDRVVTADVLAQLDELATRREEGCGMEAARRLEDGLGGPHHARHGLQHGAADRRTGGQRLDPGHELIGRGPATDAAAGRGHEVPVSDRGQVDRPWRPDEDLVVGLGVRRGVAELDRRTWGIGRRPGGPRR